MHDARPYNDTDHTVCRLSGTGRAASAGSAPKLHAACSALRFEPREDVLWEITFREKLTEDLTVELIGKAAK